LVSQQGVESRIVKRTTVLHDSAGEVCGSVVIFRDVTDQLRAASGQRRLMEELSQANESLRQFAYSASHDLQEPLRTIAIYSQLLWRKLEKETDREIVEYLGFTMQGARRMQALVRGLREYSEAGAAEAEGPFEQVDCRHALDMALETLSAPIQENQAQITADPLPVVSAHSANIVQLFQNLIGNALKYRGFPAPRVEIRAARLEGAWEFSVCDNGIGIPARYHAHVFGVFKRLHAQGTCVETGIGLAICKKIIERYNGKIWIDSTEGQGSTFHFTLPDILPSKGD
jgi:light-regulated signal transduction histidine kinase (bacteriophytochrome)